MKILKIAVVTFILMASQLLAQTGQFGKGNPTGEPRIEEWKVELGLSQDQVTKWNNIHDKYKPKLDKIKVNTDLSRAEKIDAMNDLKSEKDKEIQLLLSNDQWTKFEEIRNSRKYQGRGQGQGMRQGKGKGMGQGQGMMRNR